MALVIIRFALRIHVLLVVTVAGIVTAVIGSIFLITSVVGTTHHVKLEPIDIALWVIPTAIGPC